MKIICVWMRTGLLLACTGILLTGAGCGKRRPVNIGEADMIALGYGIGRELMNDVSRGDTLLLFGVPNAVGYTDELERGIVRGLNSQLGNEGVRIVRVRYTEEEGETYMRGQHQSLHPDFAQEAFNRHGGSTARAVVSLLGWPDTRDSFLPENITFVGVSWNYYVDPDAWLRQFNQVISIVTWGQPAEGRPSRRALRSEEEILHWFDDRFEVAKGARL